MHTSFKEKLSTNYAPTESEAGEIQDLLSGPVEKLTLLDQKLSLMQAALDELSNEREVLSDDIDAHRALLSPARQLPHDIIQEIFMSCLPTDRNAAMSATEAPVLLGRICSQWRTISLSTPRLWSSVHVPVPVPNNKDDVAEFDSPRREALKEWFRRSGACPLSISFTCRPTNPECVTPLLKILISVSSRWRNVRFMLPNSALYPIAELSQRDVPMLENIVVEIPRHENWHTGPYPPTDRVCVNDLGLLDAPVLTNVSLFDVGPDLVHIHLRRWAHITHLTMEFSNWRGLTGVPMTDALAIMQNCQNLRSCSLQLSGTFLDQFGDSTSLVTVPLLTSFSVIEGLDTDATGYFKCLHLPSLRRIAFRKENFPPSPPSPIVGQTPWTNSSPKTSLLALLSRTASHISSLQLNSTSLTLEDVLDCLRLVPHITRLAFDMPNDSFYSKQSWLHVPYYPHPPTINTALAVLGDSLLRVLTPPLEGTVDDTEYLCPHLKIFECGGGRGYFTEDAVLELIRGRSTLGEGSSLERMTVWFGGEKKNDLSAELSALVEKGLELDLHYPITYPLPARKPYTHWDGLPVRLRPSQPTAALPPFVYGGWDGV